MTASAADFVTADRFAAQFAPMMSMPVPGAAAAHLQRLVADTVAIAAYARRHRIGACAVDDPGEVMGGPAEVWGTGQRTGAESAALLNATAAEALDFQEVFIDGRNNGHAAVVIVPALVALDAVRPDPDRLLHALWVAFTANAHLARALGRGHRTGEPGFRTTSLTAPIAAAAAGGYLISDQLVAVHSSAIAAASLPAGLLAAMAPGGGSFSVDKDLSVGFSARHVVTCVRLAARGATGPASALSGPRSWLASYGYGTGDEAALIADPLAVDLAKYALKLYPANYGCQCAIRLALDLARDLDPDRIARVRVHVKSSSADSLSARIINTHVSARFSLAYAVASAICRKRSQLADFEGDALRDPQILAFMDRIEVLADDAFQALHEREGVFPCRMELALTDGTTQADTRTTPYDGDGTGHLDSALRTKIHSLCETGQARAILGLAEAGGWHTIHRLFGN